jgi:K(+)-stimulated pyrophosphate-energized sodium pump
VTEYYTGTQYAPVNIMASTTGPGTNIIANGRVRNALPPLGLSVSPVSPLAGLYGIAVLTTAM